MLLTTAIEHVVKDTRENTDPKFTISQAIESAREDNTLKDISDMLDDGDMTAELADAYMTVLAATDNEIERTIGLLS